jgi:hypothetical protein
MIHPPQAIRQPNRLFVREYKEENNFTAPFVFLGEAEHVKHEGNKPLSIVWRLKEEMPPALVPAANKVIVITNSILDYGLSVESEDHFSITST